MKSTALHKPYTGSGIVVCAEWINSYFPKQSELIDILHAGEQYPAYDFSKCITTSVIHDKDNSLLYYDIGPAGRTPLSFKVQEPEFYQWHKVKAYIKSDMEGGFHPNDITTTDGQKKVIRKYFTENCLLIARSHFGSIKGLKHEIRDQADGTFLMIVEYEARFEGAFSGFFE